MEKEFNLSEKIKTFDRKYQSSLFCDDGMVYAGACKFIFTGDILKAVKLLKEEIKGMSVDESMDYYDNCNFADFEKVINKVFGDKLI
jgi:hypothetical protein